MIRNYIRDHGGTFRSAAQYTFQRLSRSSFARQVSQTYLTRIVLVVLGLVSSVMVARFLGPEGRGLFSVGMTIVTIGIQFGNLGLHSSNVYYAARDRQNLPRLLQNSLWVSFGFGGAGALLAWSFFRIFPRWAPLEGDLLSLSLLWIPVGLAYLLASNLLIGIGQVGAYNRIELQGRSLSILAIAACGFIWGPSIKDFFGLAFLAALVGLFLALRALRRHAPLWGGFSREWFRKTFGYGFKAYLTAFFAFLVLKVDLLMVRYNLGLEQAGYYSIASNMADMLYLFPSVVGSMLFPKLAAKSDIREKWAFSLKAMGITAALMVPLALAAAVAAKPAVLLLYGEVFRPAVAPFWVLCLAMIFYGANNTVSNFFASVGFPPFSVYIWVIVSVLNVVLNLFLIPAYGIVGAALSSLICYASVLLSQCLYVALRGLGGIQVVRDFDRIYGDEEDPWAIGDAESERYDLYVGTILKHSSRRDSILDIGSGFGALLSRFKSEFKYLKGVEISAKAIEKGRLKYPFIHYEQGSAEELQGLEDQGRKYSTILFSDVIYYLNEEGKNGSLGWIADHLEEDGLAFIAAWSPGGAYLTRDEFRRLVGRHLTIEAEEFLGTGHSVFVCRKKRDFVAVTVDYETWHPIPEGKTIDWEKDVFGPAERLLERARLDRLPLTFMVEVGEYFWLLENRPPIARKMEEQWKRMVAEGHDVQPHLHPCWLPELGAKEVDGKWYWDWAKAKADDYPGDLDGLIGRCRSLLEGLLRPVDPAYRVTSFRAGAYQAQPFKRLAGALRKNGFLCDSSVYSGGVSLERGYDYSGAHSDHQPYWVHPEDPRFEAPPGGEDLLEIPIFTYAPGERWFLDGGEGGRLAERFRDHLLWNEGRRWTSEGYRLKLGRIRALSRLALWDQKHPLLEWDFQDVNGLPGGGGNGYFVMIGHTKADNDYERIFRELGSLGSSGRTRFRTLSSLALSAKDDLGNSPAKKEERSGIERAKAVMDRVYRELSPERPSTQDDPEAILKEGYAWCWGYAVVLGHLLKKEGFDVRWLTMMAKGHSKGRGKAGIDSHEVILARIGGRRIILDPMADSLIPHSIEELLACPSLAAPKDAPDERYRQRNYHLYDTAYWYGRVFKYAVRRDPRQRVWFWHDAPSRSR